MIDAYQVMDFLLSADSDSAGKYINEVADDLRHGGDLRQLCPLLTHPDARFASVAAWVVAEVADSIRGREVFPELCALIVHADPSVRFEAIKSIATLVHSDEPHVVRLLLQCLIDNDAAVRRQALTQICLLPDAVLDGMRGTVEWPRVQVLLAGVSKDDLKRCLSSTDLFDQRLAVAGAMRNYGDDATFIDTLIPMFDDEVRDKVGTLPRNRTYI